VVKRTSRRLTACLLMICFLILEQAIQRKVRTASGGLTMQSEKQASEIADPLKSELRQTWEKAAPGWAKWEHIFSAGLSTATETLLDAAGIRPGMRVLDLACGAGSQTIEAAKRVGSDGGVVACDISATMLDHVRKNAAAVGLQNIETLGCAAEELDETLPPFDAAICRLGLMLFRSPGTALKAMQRVLKPGARFAALVFTTPANNPFMAQTMAILLRCAGKSPKPRQPGIFALGENGILENLMQDSGLVQVQAKPVTAWLSLPNASHALEMMQEAFGACRAVVADLSDAEKSKAWGAVYACLKQFERIDGFQTQFEFIIGSGSKRS
jgi:ubiquinone/menaquinone biosynthesis C-methylase UbiE